MCANRRSRFLEVSTPLFLTFAAALYILNQIHLLSANWANRMHGNDFWHLYCGGLALRQGLSPYDGEQLRQVAAEAGIPRLNPFVYLPFTGIMMIPFTFLSPQNALLVWFFLNHLLFFGALAFLAAAVEREFRWMTVCVLLFLGAFFFPLTRTLTAGQLNIILLFLLSAAVYFLIGRRESTGGFFIGLAAMVKVSPGFLILFLAWKRRWKAVGASLAGVVVLFVISMVILGPGYGLSVHRAAVGVFRQMSYGQSTWSDYGEKFHVARANISPSSMVYRLLTSDSEYASDPDTRFRGVVDAPGAAKATSILVSLGLIALLAWASRKPNGKTFPFEFSLAMLVMLLVPSLFWDHYLVLLFVPFAFLSVASMKDLAWPFVFLWVAAAVFMSMAYPFSDGRIYEGWGTLRLAPQLFAVLLVGAVLIREIRRLKSTPEVL